MQEIIILYIIRGELKHQHKLGLKANIDITRSTKIFCLELFLCVTLHYEYRVRSSTKPRDWTYACI